MTKKKPQPINVDGIDPRPNMHPAARLLAQCEPTIDGCWEWTGHLSDGYGKMRHLGIKQGSHRVSFVLAGGVIENGQVVMHTCDNRRCVNPSHLVVGAHLDNIQDRNMKGRTACGENASRSKLTQSDVDEIRSRYSRYRVTYKMLADEYGICLRQCWMIVTGRSWSDA